MMGAVKPDVQPSWCVYCGQRCDGLTCRAHDDLPALDAPVYSSVEGGDK